MKISANEMLLINKNLKFKGDETQPASTATALAEVPASEETISALNAQSMNNIAFQGVNQIALKKMGISAMAALTLLGSMSALTSCKEDEPEPEYPKGTTIIYDNTQVTTNITVNIYMTDEELVNAVLEEIKALREENKEQTEINKAILAELINQGISLNRIMTLLDQMNMTAQDIFNLLKENSDKQDEILNEISQGNEDIKALLNQILNSVKNGNNISAANNKLLTMILVQLGQANKNDAALMQILNTILEKVNESIETNKDIATKQQVLLQAILGKLSSLDNHMKQGILAVLNKIDSVSEANIEILTSILTQINENGQNDEKSLEILNSIFDKVQESIDTNKELNAEMQNLMKHILGKLSEMDDHLKQGVLAILGHIDQASAANINLLIKLINKVDNMQTGDQNTNKILYAILAKIQESIDANKDMDNRTQLLLQSILDNVQNFNADLKTAVEELLAKMDEMQTENKILLGDILNNVQNFNEDMKTGFAAIIANQDKMSAENRAFYNRILAAISKLDHNAQRGLGMLLQQLAVNNAISAETLNKINRLIVKLDQAHQDDLKFYNQAIALLSELSSKIDKLGGKADSILDAIGNISIDANVDLSTIEQMLADILAQSQANGDVLTSIESKLNLVAITLEGIKTQLEVNEADNQAIIKKLDEILAKIPDQCKCDVSLQVIINKLDNIVEEIKKGNTHEGILDDLDDMFN